MRLRPFIIENSEAILEEFEEFARTHTTAGETMDIVALRDHAAAMLRTIVLDMEQVQSEKSQEIKSKGDAPDFDSALTAAEQHGTDRADSGFTLGEMFAEYRALRASVLRLWTESWSRRLDEQDVQDLIRFNEAIDQSLAESITKFTTGIERSREMFLAILGHDLRTPLGAVFTASEFLVSDGDLTGTNLTMASRIRSSTRRMKTMVADLLDFTSARLGRGIPLSRTDLDLVEIARETVEEIGGQHPDLEIRFEASGDARGRWDGERVRQALSNLVGNAVQHGDRSAPVRVGLRADGDEVVISVQNVGSVIAKDEQHQIFDPFRRIASADDPPEGGGSMGLGLYIAQQIALAHGGGIEVRSSPEEGTTFELRLPREG